MKERGQSDGRGSHSQTTKSKQSNPGSLVEGGGVAGVTLFPSGKDQPGLMDQLWCPGEKPQGGESTYLPNS